MIQQIKKRDGKIVAFDQNKITEAIWNAAKSVGGEDRQAAEKISNQVCSVLEVFFKDPSNVPSVEQTQDLVEKILIENGHAKTAKAYILYREEHHKLRQEKAKILGSHDSLIIKFPKNATLANVKQLIDLADKLGCEYLTAEPKTSYNHQPEKLAFQESPTRGKSMEEVIPPPIESLATLNT